LKYAAVSGREKQKYANQTKLGYQKEGRVSKADLRLKADVRDVNSSASQSKLLADNSGKVYRSSGRGAKPTDTISRDILSSKRSSGRTKTPPRDSGSWPGVSSDQDLGAKRASYKSDPRSKSQSPIVTQPQPSKSRPTDKQIRKPSSATYRAQDQMSQYRTAGKSTRQTSPTIVKTPARQPLPGTAGSSYRKQSSPRVVSAPVQKQSSYQPSFQPKNSRSSGRYHSAPAKSSSQGSTQKAGSQRNGSKSASRSRAGGSREKQ
jgi:hypothetical protein